VEKPDHALAQQFLASGRYSWNSGMFTFTAARLLEEVGRHRPDILTASRSAWERAKRDLDFLRLDEQAFGACPAESIDYAVMENTDAAAVIQIDIGWSGGLVVYLWR
jgi:mannose-1-phosphate guanylyltransferase